MIIFCPGCQKQLLVSEAILGKTVRCSGCSHVFQAEAPVQVITLQGPEKTISDTAPEANSSTGTGPPMPPLAVPPPAPQFPPGLAEETANRVRGLSLWLWLAGFVAVGGVWFNFLMILLGNPPRGSNDWTGILFAAVCLAVFFGPFWVFIFLGAGSLSRGKNRGFVLTGSVMSFILCGLFAIALFISGLVGVVQLERRRGDNGMILLALLALLINAISGLFCLFGGIKGTIGYRLMDPWRNYPPHGGYPPGGYPGPYR